MLGLMEYPSTKRTLISIRDRPGVEYSYIKAREGGTKESSEREQIRMKIQNAVIAGHRYAEYPGLIL